jgi:ribosomal protein L29
MLMNLSFLQSSKVKAGQLWGKNKDELAKQLEELKLELNQLRVQKISSGASTKTQKMCVSDTPGFSFCANGFGDLRDGNNRTPIGTTKQEDYTSKSPMGSMRKRWILRLK